MSRFKKLAVAGILIFSIGLHWPILQSVAWLNMIVSFSQEDGLEQAFVKTFNGKNPCKVCHLVAAGKKAEKKDAKDLSIKKIDLFSECDRVDVLGIETWVPHPAISALVKLRYFSPLTPPPDLV